MKSSNENTHLVISCCALVMLVILANGWSKTNEYRLFWQESETTKAKITKKTATKNSYFVTFVYHDNITAQGYTDEKKITQNLWQKITVGDTLEITYNKKKPVQNVLFLFDTQKVWEPFLRSLQIVLAIFVLIGVCAYGLKKRKK